MKADLKRVVCPAKTLRGMTVGQTVKIPTKYIKSSALRVTASRLKKNGFSFHVSEEGLVDETLVTCLKTPR